MARGLAMCHAFGCMVLTAGASAHATLWASLARRPHGLELMTAFVAVSVALSLARGVVQLLVSPDRSGFHDAWRWEGWFIEAIEATLAAPLYVPGVLLTLPWTLGAALRTDPSTDR